jgi:membrane-bound inhibitor of C-type lysozyme
MRLLILSVIGLLTACAGGDHHAHGPAGIPYACSHGTSARIHYAGGGYFPRASARLVYERGEITLHAVPPTYGLRYVSDSQSAADPVLVWSARGEEAWLAQLLQGVEREIAHCTRVREGAAEAPHH